MESIESYGLVSAETIKGFDTPTPIIHKRKSDTIDNGLNCDCGIPVGCVRLLSLSRFPDMPSRLRTNCVSVKQVVADGTTSGLFPFP